MLRAISFFAIFLLLPTIGAAETWFEWSELPGLPVQAEGVFYGVLDGRPVVAGGSVSDNNEQKYSDRIFVLEKIGAEYRWREAGTLPEPMAFGASLTHSDSTGAVVYCFGGRSDEGCSNRSVRLRFDSKSRRVLADRETADLSGPVSHFPAAVLGQRIYVAGGKNSDGETVAEFQSISLPDFVQNKGEWRTEPTWPGGARHDASLLRQNRGDRDVLYLIGGRDEKGELSNDCLMFDPLGDGDGRWHVREPVPKPAVFPAAVARGQSHLLFFGGRDTDTETSFRDVFAYHAITDTWCVGGRLPEGGSPVVAVPLEQGVALPGNVVTIKADFKPARTNFAWWDYVALFGYFGLLACLGYYLASWKKSSDDFLVGKRRIPWWAAALSLMATQVSSIARCRSRRSPTPRTGRTS